MEAFREAYLENIRMNNYPYSLNAATEEARRLRESNRQLRIALGEAIRQHGPITVGEELTERPYYEVDLSVDRKSSTRSYVISLKE